MDQRVAGHEILTVSLEDYFQVGAFQRLIAKERWYRFETRLAQNLRTTLELLSRYDVRATLFVHGWIAENLPELVSTITAEGHEVANLGYDHRDVRHMSREEFRDDLLRSHHLLERAAGTRVVGYRTSHGWLRREDLWILDVLIEEGYAYDSSLVPLLANFRSEPERRFIHRHDSAIGSIWEIPPSTIRIAGLGIPISGGNYFRQFPQSFIKRAVNRWHERTGQPFVMYFHTWELDPGQPRVQGISRITRLRHYRNLERMEKLVEEFLAKYRFVSAANHLQLDLTQSADHKARLSATVPSATRIPRSASTNGRIAKPREPVSIVIPCYNEAATLPYLKGTLNRFKEQLADDYDVRVILVDDGSQDATPEVLEKMAADEPNWSVVRHATNRGVAAAILTGVQKANTEIVCSIDCDCSYDPHALECMIPLLAADVDLVTASPYHPEGMVRNVARWRLMLSKTLSLLYRGLLPTKLHTYTSCCRVYRKSAVRNVTLQHEGFLGVAELVGRLALADATIVEFPATLESRIFGESKMKIARTIVGHLGLLFMLWRLRSRSVRPAAREYVPPVNQKAIATDTTSLELLDAGTHESNNSQRGNPVAFGPGR